MLNLAIPYAPRQRERFHGWAKIQLQIIFISLNEIKNTHKFEIESDDNSQLATFLQPLVLLALSPTLSLTLSGTNLNYYYHVCVHPFVEFANNRIALCFFSIFSRGLATDFRQIGNAPNMRDKAKI